MGGDSSRTNTTQDLDFSMISVRRMEFLRTTAVLVCDQDRSLRFYVDQIGFRLIADTRFESGDRWVAVVGSLSAKKHKIVARRRGLVARLDKHNVAAVGGKRGLSAVDAVTLANIQSRVAARLQVNVCPLNRAVKGFL
jgi:hypothetical protein